MYSKRYKLKPITFKVLSYIENVDNTFYVNELAREFRASPKTIRNATRELRELNIACNYNAKGNARAYLVNSEEDWQI